MIAVRFIFFIFFILNLFIQGNNSEYASALQLALRKKRKRKKKKRKKKKTLQHKVFKPTDKQLKTYLHFKSILSIKPMPTKERNKGRKRKRNYPRNKG